MTHRKLSEENALRSQSEVRLGSTIRLNLLKGRVHIPGPSSQLIRDLLYFRNSQILSIFPAIRGLLLRPNPSIREAIHPLMG